MFRSFVMMFYPAEAFTFNSSFHYSFSRLKTEQGFRKNGTSVMASNEIVFHGFSLFSVSSSRSRQHKKWHLVESFHTSSSSLSSVMCKKYQHWNVLQRQEERATEAKKRVQGKIENLFLTTFELWWWLFHSLSLPPARLESQRRSFSHFQFQTAKNAA